jgi:hypothetical protein
MRVENCVEANGAVEPDQVSLQAADAAAENSARDAQALSCCEKLQFDSRARLKPGVAGEKATEITDVDDGEDMAGAEPQRRERFVGRRPAARRLPPLDRGHNASTQVCDTAS